MSGYVFLFFGSLDMTKNSFSLQDERNDKVLDKERMFEDSRGEGGGVSKEIVVLRRCGY